MAKKVIILGAGLAGLSCAMHLIRRGHHVMIFEKRPYAGGRTFSFEKKFWSQPIDNGPHVMLGCYHSLLELLEICGGMDRLRIQPRLSVPFCLSADQFACLSAANLPAPFHLLIAMLKFPLLDWLQKISIIRLFLKIQRQEETANLDRISAADWLRTEKQAQSSLDVFWRPLIYATLNAAPQQISFLQLFRVLKIGFLSSKKDTAMIFMPDGLTKTLIEPMLKWLQKQDHFEIRYRESARQLLLKNDRVESLITTKNRYDQFDDIVCAMPFYRLQDLLTNSNIVDHSLVLALNQFERSAILNFHFWYKGRLILQPFAAFIRKTAQWIFVNRENDDLVYHTIVISGGNELLSRAKEELIQHLIEELGTVFANFSATKIMHQYVTIEKAATPLSKPGLEQFRPAPGPYWHNFFLAGDWTNTGLPPTMESAARSGKNAAEQINL